MLARHLWNSSTLCFVLLTSALLSRAAAQTESPHGLAADDWTNIRVACETERHRVRASEDGFEAHNPGQGWRINFDTRGFLVEPEQSAWSWGLELVSYGFENREQYVGDSACVSAEDGRVAYSWSDGIEEWYVNDTRGFEHGFTVRERPARSDEDDSSLALELRIRGDLTPRIQASRRGIAFVDQHGSAVLNYSGLTVFDANGQTLEAWFEDSINGLSLHVDESDAQYPLTIDPIAQEAYLKASNTDAFDQFGVSVSISGNTLVVGATHESSNAVGVNGNDNDNSAPFTGAAYVFIRSGTSWIQQAYLKASNTGVSTLFGNAVAIDGDTLVVAAVGDSSSATGVNGNQSDGGLGLAGAAFVFVRENTTWSQQAYLKASNTDLGDRFGETVDISGDTIVVGAIDEDSGPEGSGENDNSATNSGAAYVFVRTGTTWAQEAFLKASNAESEDGFSRSVSVDDDLVVVGAGGEDSSATGVNGVSSDNSAANSGAAYVFERVDATWNEQAYLKASNTDSEDRFGRSVSASGNSVVVGAVLERSNILGQHTNNLVDAGAAYVFVQDGTTWAQQAFLKSSDISPRDRFGRSVDISGEKLVVGAFREGFDEGAVYVFERSGTLWSQLTRLKASNVGTDDRLGISVGISDDRVVAGAPEEDGAATGVNGNQSDNSAMNAGAAYVFDLDVPVPIGTDFCSGDGGNGLGCTNCPCTNNAPMGTIGGCLNSAMTSARLAATGDASVSLPVGDTRDLRFEVSGAPPNSFNILWSGDNVAPTNPGNPCSGMNSGLRSNFYDGLRCSVGSTRRHGGRAANANGSVGVTTPPWGGEGGPQAGIAVRAGYVAGQTRFFQTIGRDNVLASCMRGLQTSQAVQITFAP